MPNTPSLDAGATQTSHEFSVKAHTARSVNDAGATQTSHEFSVKAHTARSVNSAFP